jgi:hypothetical protein
MYVYIHICILSRSNTCIHIYIHILVHKNICTCTHEHTHIYMHIVICIYIHLDINEGMYRTCITHVLIFIEVHTSHGAAVEGYTTAKRMPYT